MRTSNTAQTAIPVDEAEVQERPVSVKVITIGTRQVTQSLYKQLVCQEVIDALTCEPRGKVWGWVNLHLDCNMQKGHVHAVWNNDGILMRSCTPYKCGQVFYRENDQILKGLAEIDLCLGILDGNPIERVIRVGGQTVYPELPPVIKAGPRNFSSDYIKESLVKQMHSILQGMNEGYQWKYQWLGFDPDEERPHIWSEMEKIAKDMTKEERKWEQTYRSIQATGQLFIAVSGVWK